LPASLIPVSSYRTLSPHDATYQYQVFLPEDWSSNKKWPIILFLHRAGERGSDGLIRTQVGIGTAVRKDRTRFAAINVMPQCKTNSWWSEPAMEELALATLTAASKEFKGDPKRTYLPGLSTGGYGSWALAAQHPNKFAASRRFPGLGHNSWDNAYADPELMTWMLSKSL
jgi:predicted peptidase